MNYLRRNIIGFALSLAITLCLALEGSASSRHSSRSCSIGCNESSEKSCKNVCGSHLPVREGCIFVPEREETVIGSESCLPEQVIVPGANLYYREQGKSHGCLPTIVFVHSIGQTSDSWRCQQAQLSKCFRTIAIDLRGNGRSEVTDPQSIQYTHQLFANDLYAMLQDPALNVSKNMILVGNGLGGSVGIVYAANYPDLLSKLVIVNSGPGLYFVNNCAVDPACDPSIACDFSEDACCDLKFCSSICWPYPSVTPDQLDEQQNIIGCAIDQCFNLGGEYDFCIEQATKNYYAWTIPRTTFNEPCQPQLDNLQAQSVQAITQIALNGVLGNILFNAYTQDLRPLLEQVKVPTLVTIGTIDLSVPNGAGIYIHNHIPHSKLAKFENKGHVLQATAYKKFNKLLKSFIEHHHCADFVSIDDTCCCVCPLIKPAPFVFCSQTINISTKR